jgi:hypothetical protein
VGERGAVQVELGALSEIVGGDPAVVLAYELLRLGRLLLVEVLPEPLADVPYQRLVDVLELQSVLLVPSGESTLRRGARDTPRTRARSARGGAPSVG